ncbi:MAG: hypothetical protein ACLRFI_00360 [Alphaproteobacteria bacterium]
MGAIVMDEIAFGYLKRAVEQFYAQDKNALELQGMERSYVFRIAFYLQTFLNTDSRFNNVVVDCEYSKRINPDGTISHKTAPDAENQISNIAVDLLVHTRNSHENNLLIVEFKGWWNLKSEDWENDHTRLMFYTKHPLSETEHHLGYKLGVFVRLGAKRPCFTKYKTGRVISGRTPTYLYKRRN